jgi:hypothetical protein
MPDGADDADAAGALDAAVDTSGGDEAVVPLSDFEQATSASMHIGTNQASRFIRSP